MENFNAPRNIVDPEILKTAVMSQQKGLRADSPNERLTVNTFGSTTGIQDWADRGDLAKAVETFNSGGWVNPVSGNFVPREFYLMRLYDAAENLGRARFEQFAPGIWESMLAMYKMTFSNKLRPAADTRSDGEALNPAAMYSTPSR